MRESGPDGSTATIAPRSVRGVLVIVPTRASLPTAPSRRVVTRAVTSGGAW